MSGNDFCTLGIGNGKWPSLFPTFGIKNGNAKFNFQLLELGMKNSVPNQTWEIIDKRVQGKTWEREFPLMSASLVADPFDATPLLFILI